MSQQQQQQSAAGGLLAQSMTSVAASAAAGGVERTAPVRNSPAVTTVDGKTSVLSGGDAQSAAGSLAERKYNVQLFILIQN